MKSDAETPSPVSNTGGINAKINNLADNLRTDYIATTLRQAIHDPTLPHKAEIRENGSHTINDIIHLVQAYTENYAYLKNEKGKNNYSSACKIFDRENTLKSTIFYGGNADTVHIVGSGTEATDTQDLVNTFWQNTPSRRDICLDFHLDYDLNKLRVHLSEILGQPVHIVDRGKGIQLEIGDRKTSEYFIRLYDKSAEQGDTQGTIKRLEAEIKIPRKDQARRLWLSTADNLECIQSNKITRNTFGYIAQSEIAKVIAPRTRIQNKVNDLATSIDHLSKQYRKTILALFTHHNGDEAKVARTLLHGKL
jgi:DNA relaxase NicK